jgi:hypothetical protein
LLEHLFLDLFFGLEIGAYVFALAPVRVLIIEHIFDQELEAVWYDLLFLYGVVGIHQKLKFFVDFSHLVSILLLERLAF